MLRIFWSDSMDSMDSDPEGGLRKFLRPPRGPFDGQRPNGSTVSSTQEVGTIDHCRAEIH